MIVHLLGFPGVGKRTVAHELRQQGTQHGLRFVVVDNHLTSLPILSVVDADGTRPLPEGVWGRVDEIREVVYRAIEDLAPPDTAFVFTNVLVESDPTSPTVVARLQRLATARSTTYRAVVLGCELTEHRRRVIAPDRLEHRKWTDPDGVDAFVTTEQLHRPEPVALELDITEVPPPQAASEILRALGLS